MPGGQFERKEVRKFENRRNSIGRIFSAIGGILDVLTLNPIGGQILPQLAVRFLMESLGNILVNSAFTLDWIPHNCQ